MGDVNNARLDRSGSNQREFGMQGGAMQFPSDYTSWQPEPTDNDQPRHTTPWRFKRQLDIDKKLALGTPLFVQKAVNVSSHTMWSLPLLRYQLRMARERLTQSKQHLSGPYPSAKRVKLGEPDTDMFLATMDSFFDNVEFAGVVLGSPSPHAANGPRENSFSLLSVKQQVVASVTMGHAYFPNYFYSDIRNQQELFMIIKPIEVRHASNFVSPYGDPTATSLEDTDLVIDVIFFTNRENRPPRRISSVDAINLITTGKQPPTTSSSYIEMVDGDYELKHGLVYSIGKSLHDYPMRPTYMSTSEQGIPQEMQPSTTTAMMEIALNIRRLY